MTLFSLPWGTKVTGDFRKALVAGCKGLGWQPQHAQWLMGDIGFESAHTFRSDVRNAAGSGAVGLIQFMPTTALGLGTTVENLALLSPESQMFYVFAYFKPYAKRVQTFEDSYAAILLPSAIGKPNDTVLFTDGTTAYRQNAGLDANNDGKVTKLEACSRVKAVLLEGSRPGNAMTIDWDNPT